MTTRIEITYWRQWADGGEPEDDYVEIAKRVQAKIDQMIFEEVDTSIVPLEFSVRADHEIPTNIDTCNYVGRAIKGWIEEEGCESDIRIIQTVYQANTTR